MTVALALGLSACGSDSSSESTSTPTPSPTTVVAPAQTPATTAVVAKPAGSAKEATKALCREIESAGRTVADGRFVAGGLVLSRAVNTYGEKADPTVVGPAKRMLAAGLDGDVDAEGLARLFDGVHPVSGQPLGASYRVRDGADRVTGWDLTFSAPKSVSVLWATGGAEVGFDVRDAHDAAVAAGVAYLEEHAAFARTGKGGVRQVDTEGFVAAGFVHRSSRAGDPQLHTHVLVSGRVRSTGDGVWRALDSRGLHRQLKPAGMVYQAALRVELTERLGVHWGPVDGHGQADIDGVPTELATLFSKRTAQVEPRAAELIAEAEEKLGRGLTAKGRARFYEVAVLETRTAKDHTGEDDRGLFDRWRTEAATAGLDPDRWVAPVIDRDRPDPELDREAVVAEVLAELAGAQSTWTRTDVVRRLARRVPVGLGDAGETRAWIESTADEVLAHRSIVALAAPEPPPPGDLRRRDGRSVFERHAATRFTTDATLAVEQQVLDIDTAGRGAGRGIANRWRSTR